MKRWRRGLGGEVRWRWRRSSWRPSEPGGDRRGRVGGSRVRLCRRGLRISGLVRFGARLWRGLLRISGQTGLGFVASGLPDLSGQHGGFQSSGLTDIWTAVLWRRSLAVVGSRERRPHRFRCVGCVRRGRWVRVRRRLRVTRRKSSPLRIARSRACICWMCSSLGGERSVLPAKRVSISTAWTSSRRCLKVRRVARVEPGAFGGRGWRCGR